MSIEVKIKSKGDRVGDITSDNIGRQINGGGFAITTGVKGYIIIPYNCVWNTTEAIGDVAGNIALTLGAVAGVNWTFAAPLSGKQIFNNADTTYTKGDIVAINVTGNTGNVTQLDLFMILTRT